MGGVDYQYDGQGRRVQQTVSSTVTKYLLDIQPGLSVVLSETTGSSVVRNIHAPKGIHARKDATNNWHWMMQDGLGSVRAEVSNAIAVEDSQNFSPYGTPTDSLGSFGTYGFTGEPTDVNGLVYDRARYYVPSIGMFASLDPFEGIEEEPMSMNGYSYVHGNPVNWTDPSGEFLPFLLGIILAGGAVGGVIGGASAGRMYDLANSGACGCNMKQWAAGQNRTDFILQAALQGAAKGAIGTGLALIAPELTAVGGFLLASNNAAQGIQNFNRDPNPCTQFARDLGLASAVVAGAGVVGVGLSYGGPGPTPQLVPATAGAGSGGVSGSAAVVGAGVTTEGGIVGGIAGGIGSNVWQSNVTIEGQPDSPHEAAQAEKFGRIYGGGNFRFLGNHSQGIEGFFKPTGGISEFPVSLKDFDDTGRLPNIIARINRNATQVANAGYAGKTVLHATLKQFIASDIGNFIQNGPIKNMPLEGNFTTLFFEGADGLVVVELNGIQITGIP